MFKSKINPEELSSKTYKDYVVLLKKEIKKAQKFGRSNVVVLSHFKFACGTVGTMMIVGKFGGPLAKWYKKIRKERAMEKDFALGDCFFEPQDDGSTKLHIALSQGKGKPNHMTKNGKKMFKKLGFMPNIFKGELPEDLVSGNEETFSETEVEIINEEAEESNENKSLGNVYRQYTKAFKMLANQIIPRLKMPKEEAAWNPKHFDIAKNALMLSKSFVDKFEESSERIQKKFEEIRTKILDKEVTLKKIAVKVRSLLKEKSQVHGSTDDVEQILKDTQATIKSMREDFKKAFALIDNIKKAKNKG